MKLSKTKFIPIALFAVIASGFLSAKPIFADNCTAQSSAGTGIFEDIGRCQECGDCSLCDFLTLGTNIARWILNVMGGLAIVYFVWAGIGFIISFGNAEKVAESKKAVVGAVIGIIIIIGAWTLVNILFIGFTGQNTVGVVKVWGSTPWSTLSGMCP